MIIITENTSQDLFNKQLVNLLEVDNFDGFSNLVNRKKELKISFDIPSLVLPSVALRYVELILYKQKQHYSINYINYLVSNHYSKNVITFFNNLRALEPINENKIRENPINELLQNIINNKDLDLLHYLLEFPVVMLGDFKNTNYIVSVFIKNNFSEGLEYLKYDHSFELYVVQEVVSNLKNEVKVNWSQFQKLLNLSDLALFQSILSEHVESEKIKNSLDWGSLKDKMGLKNYKAMVAVMPLESPPRLMDGMTNGIEIVRDSLNYNSSIGLKSKYYQYQRIGYKSPSSEVESLWLKYKLEVNLSSKQKNDIYIKI